MNGGFTADVQSRLEAELDRGERIVWQEKARPAFPGARGLLPLVFVAVWLCFVGAIMFQGSHGRGGHSPPPFFFAPFLLIALISFAAPALRFFNTRQGYYLITDRRALIITLGATKKVLTYYPEKLQSFERRERADGKGDLVFERSPWANAGRANAYLQEVGFLNIPDVKNVEGLLRNLAQKAPARP